MIRKLKNNFLKFGLMSIFLSGTLVSIPFVTDLNNNKNGTQTNNNIDKKSNKIEGENLVKKLNKKYVEKNKIYKVSEAKEIIDKLDKNQVKILKKYVENEQKEFNKQSQFEENISSIKKEQLNLSEKFYTSWYWATLTYHWGVQESKNISNVLSLVSIGTGAASMYNLEIPGLNLILGISSIATGALSYVFGNPGYNGVKLDLLFGFIPTYFGAY